MPGIESRHFASNLEFAAASAAGRSVACSVPPPVTAAAPLVTRVIIVKRIIFIFVELNQTAMHWLSDINPPPNALIRDGISFARLASQTQRDALMTSEVDLHQRWLPD
jgi:hypothetical protein